MSGRDAAPDALVGRPVRRKEDERLLTGRGLYVEDVKLPDMLHVGFVRSAHAHAAVRAVRREVALALPGVVAVLTEDDCPDLGVSLPALLEPGTLNNPYCDLNV